MENTYSVEAGTDASWIVTITYTDVNGDEQPYTEFVVGDTLTAELWAGQDQPVKVSPNVSWQTTPNTGIFSLTLTSEMSTDLTPGKYRLRVLVTATDATVRPVLDTVLQIVASPGTATTITPYCQYSDLLELAPYLESLEDVDTDLSGCLRQRIRARKYIDSLIIARAPNQCYLNGGVPLWQSSGYGAGNNLYITQQLAADKLMLTPRLVELVAHKAVAYVLDGLISPKDSDYAQKARQHHGEASNLLSGYIADLDINQDGVSDIPIHCNYTTSRVSTPTNCFGRGR